MTRTSGKAAAIDGVGSNRHDESTSASMLARDTSTFIAAFSASSEVSSGAAPKSAGTASNLLQRKAPPASGANLAVQAPEHNKKDDQGLQGGPANEEGPKKAKKEIRRDSKGFERFEDYFSDEDDEDGVDDVEGDDGRGGSAGADQREACEEASIRPPVTDSVETPDGQKDTGAHPPKDAVNPENRNAGSLGDVAAATLASKASAVTDLSKEWDEDDDGGDGSGGGGQDDEAAGSAATEQEVASAETIESIESFIQDDKRKGSSKDTQVSAKKDDPAQVQEGVKEKDTGENGTGLPKKSAAAAAATSGNQQPHHQPRKSKSKEEWVTYIFGEDGKHIGPETAREAGTPSNEPDPKKSVYDLNPEGEDFSGE